MRGGATLQQYRCPNPACGKAFNSLDVFNLMPTPGSGSRQLSCDICGSEIEMVIDDGGQTTGSMEDRKERIKVGVLMLRSCWLRGSGWLPRQTLPQAGCN